MTRTSQDQVIAQGNIPILAGLAIVFAFCFILSAYVNLIPDECSYWAWSRRLDWSYFDNSGMVAYLIRLSTELFGQSTPFSVRFPFLVLSVLSSGLIYFCSLNIFGSVRLALITTLVFNITPVSLLGASAAIHDNILVFFTILTMWFLTMYLRHRENKYLYLSGVAIGFSILSKYTGILTLACVFVFMIWRKETRSLLLTRTPWLSAGLALLFTLPIIYWNWVHDWASLNHILFIGTGYTGLSRKIADGFGFNLSQFLLVSPLMYVCVVAAMACSLYHNIRKPDGGQALCLSFGLPLLIFSVQSFRGHVEANWSIPGYVGPCVLAVWSFYSDGTRALNWFGKPWGPRFVRWTVVSSVSIFCLVAAHAWVGLLPASLERSFAKEDRIIWETRGWNALGAHVGNLAREHEVIAADSYQLCALLEFNIPGQPRVRYLAPWGRPTQFDVWNPSFDDLKGRDIIFVSPRKLVPSSDAFTTIYENFRSVEPLPEFKVMYHGESVREIFIYRCSGFDPEKPRRLGPRSLFYKDY